MSKSFWNSHEGMDEAIIRSIKQQKLTTEGIRKALAVEGMENDWHTIKNHLIKLEVKGRVRLEGNLWSAVRKKGGRL